MTNIVAHKPAANLLPGDGFDLACNGHTSSMIVDALSHVDGGVYVFVTVTGGYMMGDPYMFRLPFDFDCPLTYAVG